MAEVATTKEYLGRLFRIRRTCVEMLEDRGYQVSGDQKFARLDDFKEKFVREEGGQLLISKEQLVLYGEKPPLSEADLEAMDAEERQTMVDEWTRDKCMCVFFVGHREKLAEAQIRQYYQIMVQKGSNRSIVVTPTKPTPQCALAINACEAAEESPKIFEVFMESELQINVMKHELVPKHQVLTAAEKRALLSALSIKESQLPRLQQADPVARHLGMRRGQVVRITRPSETAGEYVTYRLVQA
eukprot:TRINITY_DN66434_c0_g1_i1.p1 TRINITY_DN66434_c0_g1~~TRINITY_DN66434_c0_g1_i1.p1  ORF type:complete len:270 (+),score=108.33 TRINITY_DN66434_c0_g1_i1:84-812(+)